jgi:uroporphyrin-III C-methyltransferase / precorrin-2 dehydrogenase / sirohydrochlorin ferrochelatase
MSYLPIFISLTDKPCLLIGGGEVAARKAAQLLRSGARVTVVAPQLGPTLASMYEQGLIQHKNAEFTPSDLTGVGLIIAATNHPEINQTVAALASTRDLLINVVDDPSLCNFIMPSIIDRSPVQIAISTGGASPVLARLLRARLETLIPAAYGRLASLMRAFREQVKRKFPDMTLRRRFWEKALQGPVAEMLFAGQEKAALAALQKQLEDETAPLEALGEVYLVGGGPGDPDLLTFRALRLMQQADVVLYDRLVAPAILDLVRREAERIYVGKQRDQHTLPQEDINAYLIRLARQGKRVLRLKGGDPFIFGRGGEEIETLSAEGIPFQVVPGITAASGCACYAGIPLTHRDHAHACIFVAGHVKGDTIDLNWEVLAQPKQTIAVYMGLHGLDILCRELIHHGLPASMPAALIQQGTTQNQRVLTGTLADLPEIAKSQVIRPPSMVIVGEVVKLHEKLAWFEPVSARIAS